jgi:catechol 2,3-dioxygenase-like lactoylglutathione lyase family enzyme
MRLRQIALAARDLDATTDLLCDVLGVEVGFRDPGVAEFGLVNAVMPIGNHFLEVVSPAREGTTAGRWLERCGGDAGYMAIFQVRDLARERGRVASLGVRIVWEAKLADAATIHLHPRDVGGAIVSLDAMPAWDDWKWAGPHWREKSLRDVCAGFAGATLASPRPAELAKRWGEVLGRGADGNAIALEEGGVLRFEEGAAEALAGVALRVVDPARFAARAQARGVREPDGSARMCGVRFHAA